MERSKVVPNKEGGETKGEQDPDEGKYDLEAMFDCIHRAW